MLPSEAASECVLETQSSKPTMEGGRKPGGKIQPGQRLGGGGPRLLSAAFQDQTSAFPAQEGAGPTGGELRMGTWGQLGDLACLSIWGKCQ